MNTAVSRPRLHHQVRSLRILHLLEQLIPNYIKGEYDFPKNMEAGLKHIGHGWEAVEKIAVTQASH